MGDDDDGGSIGGDGCPGGAMRGAGDGVDGELPDDDDATPAAATRGGGG